MDILSKNFKFYFQLILIVFTLVIWVSMAVSDIVIPNSTAKNSTPPLAKVFFIYLALHK